MIIGLSGAGKTFFLYNALLEEGWQDDYRKGPEYEDGASTVKLPGNQKRQEDFGFSPKYIALEPTMGFNGEMFSDKIDYCCWDVSGKEIYNGEQNSEYFGTGSELGIRIILREVSFYGVIYVINVSRDIEILLQSKDTLHSVIFGNGQLKGKECFLVYNKQPELTKKAARNPDPFRLNEMCNREEMRQVNNAYNECPFSHELLDTFFNIEKLSKIVKVKTYYFDASDASKCRNVLKEMGEEISVVQKDEKKAMEKA